MPTGSDGGGQPPTGSGSPVTPGQQASATTLTAITTTMLVGDVAGMIVIINSVPTMQGEAASLSLKGESLHIKASSMMQLERETQTSTNSIPWKSTGTVLDGFCTFYHV